VTITVRQAGEGDFDEVLRLLDSMDETMYGDRQSADVAVLREMYRSIIVDPDQHILLAEVDGAAVGTAHVMVLRHFGRHPTRSAVIEGVAVDPAQRRSGVGVALMREAAEVARGQACYKVALSSNLARTGAHRFYSRLGWKRSHYGYSLELT
jgi:GNAT superfamily N-acetyltransferase